MTDQSIQLKGLQWLINPKVTAAFIFASVFLVFIGYHWPLPVQLLLNWIIVGYFIAESVIKIAIDGRRAYFASGACRFDFSIMLISALVMLIPGEALGSVAALRAVRLISLLRIMRFVPNSQQIIDGLIRALKATRTVLMLLLVLLVFAAILGYTAFSQSLPEYFGTPITALNSVFGVFTIENWGAIPEAAKATGNSTLYYTVNGFVITVLVLGGFVALSLANAVFVDEMVSDNNDELKQQINRLEAKLDRLIEQECTSEQSNL